MGVAALMAKKTYTPWHIRVFHQSRTHVGRLHMLGKRIERPVARSSTYRNRFKRFTHRKWHVGRGIHASGKRTSGKVHASGNACRGKFTRRENERRGGVYELENVRRGKMNVGRGVHASENERRGRCVPRIVSFSATIQISLKCSSMRALMLALMNACSLHCLMQCVVIKPCTLVHAHMHEDQDQI